MSNTSDKLYLERDDRFNKVLNLEVPDRIPVMLEMSYFPAKYMGITCEAAFNNYNLWLKAYTKAVSDYAPDVVQILPFFPGSFYDILDAKQVKLPGHGISAYHSQQFIEGEYLKAEDYDWLMEDSTDFNLRGFLPRIYGALEPLNQLPPLRKATFSYYEVPALAEAIASPEVQQALKALAKAGREIRRWHSRMGAFGQKIENLGFPLYGTPVAHIPFDHISYQMRGMKGIFMDMYRRPEKLIEVFDWMLPIQIKKALDSARAGGRKRVMFAVHRGADNFMSKKQFETFYWPYVKKLVNGLVNEGFIPCIFFEGDYTSRLEHFLELPKGKVLARLDSSDIFLAKKILHGHMSIMGNVPASILQTGSVSDVEQYCKKLIDVVGKDGGFIMCPRSTPDEAKPENLKAMVDFTRKFGVYA